MKAKMTFLGGPETGDVGRCVWGDYEFELNKAVEVTDDHIITKALRNKFFKVQMIDDGGSGAKAEPEAEPDDDDDADEETKARAKALPPRPTTSATRSPSRSR